MTEVSDIFEKYYQDYLERLSTVDFEAVKDTLGIAVDCGKMFIPFFKKR